MSATFPDLASKTAFRPAREMQSPAQLALDIAVLMLALIVPTLLALALDERQIFGATPWLKPLHFELSLAAHFATLALLVALMTEQAKGGRLMRWSMLAAAFAALFEIGYILLQAARGQTSHFNQSTPLAAALYALMGFGALALVAASFVTGWQVWRHGRPGVSPGLRLGAMLGLMLGSIATLIVAGALSSGTSHWIGGVASDAAGLPVLGWATKGGDLRVPHFFSTHAMQALPLAGWLADHFFSRRATALVWAATGLWLALVVFTFVQALAGKPFLAV